MSGRITTHVLDLAGGKPVAGMRVELWYLGDGESAETRGEMTFIGFCETNVDGRADRPLLEGEPMKTGIYELVFAAGDHFRRSPQLSSLTDSMFDRIPIRLRIKDGGSHYHVPLLVAPGGYSTYRGS
ncbi:hydroxyisourate hydrolase [Paenibacillus sp. N4]|uniref:hydroxyisourate hydrolase n=1 Tax=Paenibacillus vietnamensis TaxID=2590547 RepID=UPI001CD15882|nr:hydroxyisourate hydrolase [Paenibacillus vietnamensis]MCA0754172.1 hydroxyisourate hydrolase [Paenibacillus vietnamensis]